MFVVSSATKRLLASADQETSDAKPIHFGFDRHRFPGIRARRLFVSGSLSNCTPGEGSHGEKVFLPSCITGPSEFSAKKEGDKNAKFDH